MATTEVTSEIPPPSEAKKARFAELVEEYHALVDIERWQGLTPAQAEHLQQVDAEMDDIEACMPHAIYMRQRRDAFQPKLDEIDALQITKSREL
jgi:hypothetical protein